MVTAISPLVFAELDAILQEEETIQENVLLARNYFNGIQEVYLTARAMEFLGLHGDQNTFKLNVCRTIVTTVANELNLIGFDTNEKSDGGKPKEQAVWAMDVYKKNKLDSLQDTVHEGALADSETFVIVEWDAEQKYPRMIHNPRFVSVDAGGDGMGVWMVYENGDPNQPLIAAVKQWIDTQYDVNGQPHSVKRRTIYYPDRIERWVYRTATWEHFTNMVDEAWPQPWVDKQGEPLGIPVFHFKNKGQRSEHWDGIPMQDAINKQLVDILAAGDLTAFKSLFGFGFYPTIDGKEPKADGSNVMKMGPAQFNGTMKPPDQASLHEIEGADVTPLVETLVKLVLFTAQITDTPASKFVVTAAIASEKTIKEQDAGLKKKATDRRGLFGDPWAAAMAMARKLSNFYSNTLLSEEIKLLPMWEHTETLEELKEKRDTLNIPLEQLWLEAGYTPEQIAAMKQTSEYRVAFEKALWEGYNVASQSGMPLEMYLERIGLPEEEIKAITDAITNQSGVPTTDL